MDYIWVLTMGLGKGGKKALCCIKQNYAVI